MIGILCMSYGGPKNIDEVEEYFTHILQGKQPPPNLLNEIKTQFRSLCSADPLRTVTLRQVDGLRQMLEYEAEANVKVYTGFKHANPSIEDTVKSMINDGITHIITFPLIPLHSKRGVPMYQNAVQDEVTKINSSVQVTHLEEWHTHPLFIEVMARRVQEAYEWISKENHTTVIFTAHSLPGLEEDHPKYVTQFKEMAEAIIDKLQLPHWKIAYRSGRSKGQWLGPDIKAAIEEEKRIGANGVVVCELLSLTDQIEVLNEIDHECSELTAELGIDFARAASPNDSVDFIHALTEIVKEYMKQ